MSGIEFLWDFISLNRVKDDYNDGVMPWLTAAFMDSIDFMDVRAESHKDWQLWLRKELESDIIYRITAPVPFGGWIPGSMSKRDEEHWVWSRR